MKKCRNAVIFFKITLGITLILGFGLLGFGLIQTFSQPMKVGWQFKNPYFLSNYENEQKLILKKGLIKLIIGLIILFASGTGLQYLSKSKIPKNQIEKNGL